MAVRSMSLIQTRHLILAVAVTAALWVPWMIATVPDQTIPLVQPSPVRIPAIASMAERPPSLNLMVQPDGGPNPMVTPEMQINETAVPATPVAPALTPPPLLVGTAIGPRGRAVAVLRSATGSAETVRKGEGVDGWVVTRITKGSITIFQRGESRTLSMTRPQTPSQPAVSETEAP